jgi:crossover junction endodeoxyribonuclease RusA
MIFTLELPYPGSALSSNSRAHWRSKHTATKKARWAALILSKEAGVTTDLNAILRFTYHPSDLRRRDCQNVPHSLKAYIDGIADAMKCDDNAFLVYYPPRFSSVVKGGLIVCEIETK